MTEKSRISNALSAEYNELLQEKEDGVAESRREPTAWEALKGGGANHYHTPGGVQPIDLFRSIKPHESLSGFDVKALEDCIKYAHRQLTRGYLESDTAKMIHYLKLLQAAKK